MKKKIALLPGDGIGPEVMEQALLVLRKIENLFHHDFLCTHASVGGDAIETHGEPLPQETITLCEESDAILFGSVGGPQWDHLPSHQRPEVGSLLPLRKHFDLFANLRPAGVTKALQEFSPLKNRIVGDGFEYLIVRELTGDIYFGKKTGDSTSYGADEMKYTKPEIERIARIAFQYSQKRRKKVTSVDKANVLETSRFWRQVLEEVHAREFPDVELHHLYIDNATMQVLTNPHQFDVIVTGNLFGDILSDESAQISGSIGMQGSASMNANGFGLFEPMGGSAPDIAGKNIANPIAQIECVAMMLESFGLVVEAQCIRTAITECLNDGIRTGDIALPEDRCVGTMAMGGEILSRMR